MELLLPFILLFSQVNDRPAEHNTPQVIYLAPEKPKYDFSTYPEIKHLKCKCGRCEFVEAPFGCLWTDSVAWSDPTGKIRPVYPDVCPQCKQYLDHDKGLIHEQINQWIISAWWDIHYPRNEKTQ